MVSERARERRACNRVPGFSATEQDSRVRINALSNCDPRATTENVRRARIAAISLTYATDEDAVLN